MKKLNTLVLGLATFLAVSCGKETKKEDPVPETQTQNPVQKTCQLIYESQGTPSFSYQHDATGKVIRITTSSPFPPNYGSSQELLYNADGNIAEVKSYTGNMELTSFKTYSYNANKLPETIMNYEVYANGPIYRGAELFEYNTANQLVKLSMLGPSQSVPSSYYVYTYPAADESKEEYFAADATGNVRLVSTTSKHYDNKKSPYSLLNFLYTRMLVSKHNDLAVTYTNHASGTTQTNTRTYEYNEEDYPVKITIVSQGSNPPAFMTWSYLCQ